MKANIINEDSVTKKYRGREIDIDIYSDKCFKIKGDSELTSVNPCYVEMTQETYNDIHEGDPVMVKDKWNSLIPATINKKIKLLYKKGESKRRYDIEVLHNDDTLEEIKWGNWILID